MPWKVTQLSHKPFPSGRVTHGAIYALRQLCKEFKLSGSTVNKVINKITFKLPPLGVRLVGRPMVHNPTPNYARLCIPFVSATELIYGEVDTNSFIEERLSDSAIEELANRIQVIEECDPNPNAFYPQKMIVEFTDGHILERAIPYAWGHPKFPLTEEESNSKFINCVVMGHGRSAHGAAERMISSLRRIEEIEDLRFLFDFLQKPT